ncbi:MAG: glycosyltransferase family 4 protein [Syntrophobacteraceae bacterium]
MIFLSTLLISVFITIALIPVFSTLAIRLHIMDIPDERKVHSRPIPRSGGMAMALGTLIPIVLWLPFDDFLRAMVLGTGIIVIFGIVDDSRGLRYLTKFAAQIAAALVVIFYGGIWISDLGNLLPEGIRLPGWIGIPLTIVGIVGATNALNLSDGLDGLAGGLSILTFICIAYLAYLGEDLTVMLLSIAVIGSIFGFLRFNTYPANLFMGDTGSQFLGFLGICLALRLTQTNAEFSKVLPLMLLGIPILDTLSVMLGRIAHGKSPFMPDKNHLHHRFVQLSLSHPETVILIYILQSTLVTLAYLLRSGSEWILLISYLVFSAVILLGLWVAEKNGWLFERGQIVVRLAEHLRNIRDRHVIIMASFRICEWGLPMLLLLTAMISMEVPVYVSYFSAGFIALVSLTWFARKAWIVGALRLSLYLCIPYAVYFAETDKALWVGAGPAEAYNLAFGVLVIFILLTLKFTRRQKGFKTTPLDFLILFVALIVPRLPDAPIGSAHMSHVAAKIIVFFFGFEVLIGELRGEYGNLALATIAILAVLSVRGLFML